MVVNFKMPYLDKDGHICGFLDLEEKEGSGIFLRRFFMLDKRSRLFEYFMDHPKNLPDGSKVVGTFNMQLVSMVREAMKSKPKLQFCFTLTVMGRNHFFATNDPTDRDEWIQHLKDACKITVDNEYYDDEQCDSIGSYTTEICGGIAHRIALESQTQTDSDFDSSCDELERDEVDLGHASTSAPIRAGYCVKQGYLRKNWKRRYFVLTDGGIAYYKSKDDKTPIRRIRKHEIVEARISVGIHLSRDHLLELVTPHRVFYVQTESDADRDDWIFAINKLTKHSTARRLKSEEVDRSGSEPLMLLYHRQLSEIPVPQKHKSFPPGNSSTL